MSNDLEGRSQLDRAERENGQRITTMNERGLDSAVIGRVLVLQEALLSAPDEQGLVATAVRGLAEFPGVRRAAACLDGVVRWSDGRPRSACLVASRCTRLRGGDYPECPFQPAESWRSLDLRTPRAGFGVLFLEAGANCEFPASLPLAHVTANLVALRLEADRTVAGFAARSRALDEEIRESTRQLRESEALLARSQEIAHVGSWALDVVTGLLTWSDEVYRIFGLPPREFGASYQAFLDAVHPDDRDRVDAAYTASLREGRDSYDIEHRVVRRDNGTIRVVHEKCVHLRDESGSIVRSVGMVQDVTESKRAEEERFALERRFQQAQKMESLGVLAGGIAHDFNNLLMAILGNAELALDSLPADSPARRNLREIDSSAKRAADLARQMLAYSGRGRFVTERIDAGALVRGMEHLLEVAVTERILLRFDFAANLPAFEGDVAQIRQVIMNLVSNASEAIGDGEGIITLSTGVTCYDRHDIETGSGLPPPLGTGLPEGPYVYLQVADTGCGMSAATIERIFDPFFTTKFTGRGLGMSAVLGIVRGHHGTISIESELGKGSTVRLLFPAAGSPRPKP